MANKLIGGETASRARQDAPADRHVEQVMQRGRRTGLSSHERSIDREAEVVGEHGDQDRLDGEDQTDGDAPDTQRIELLLCGWVDGHSAPPRRGVCGGNLRSSGNDDDCCVAIITCPPYPPGLPARFGAFFLQVGSFCCPVAFPIARDSFVLIGPSAAAGVATE
jgi:hypothetical protein